MTRSDHATIGKYLWVVSLRLECQCNLVVNIISSSLPSLLQYGAGIGVDETTCDAAIALSTMSMSSEQHTHIFPRTYTNINAI